MKNLKKVLSLALAFAMVLSLVVFGSAETLDVTTAADWDSVTDKDSAILLNAFNIMQGDENGFRPFDNIKRSEAAKMLAVAMWGGIDNEPLYHSGNVGVYNDIELGAWYMGYVNYVTAVGIMTGKGEGRFDPEGQVTGYELLKMCLVALGYDPTNSEHGENLVGAGWEHRTMVLATAKLRKNLTEGTTVTAWAAPLDRMNAATIIKNMINRQMVEYNDDGGVNVLGYTFGEAILGLVRKTGVLAANEYGVTGNASHAAYVLPIDLSVEENAGKNVGIYVNEPDTGVVYTTMTTELLDIGTPVTLYYSGDDLLIASLNGWTETAEVKNADKVVTNYEADRTTVTHGNTGINPAVFVEGTHADFDANGKIDQSTAVTFDAVAKVSAVVETENFGTVYALGDAKWNARSMDKANTALEAGFIQKSASNIDAVEGDWIVYGVNDTTAIKDATYTYGYVLEGVEGKIDRVQYNKDSVPTTIYVDGVKYANAVSTLKFGDEGTFYTYPNGVVAALVNESGAQTGATTYALIYDAGWDKYGSTTTIGGKAGVIVEVTAILQDGTVGTYEVASVKIGDGIYAMADQNETKLQGTAGTTGMTGKKADGTTAAIADGLFKTTGGLLTTVDNDEGNVDKVVSYTLNDDGTMNITGFYSRDTFIDANVEVKSGVASVATGTTGSTVTKYFNAGSISFVETQDYASDKTETWTVYTGTSTPSYKIKTGEQVDVVLGNMYNTDGTSDDQAVAVAVVEADDKTTVTVDAVYYIVSNNGVVGVDGGSNVYSVTIYDTETTEVTTVETKVGVVAGTLYSNSDFTTLLGGTKGFITRIDGTLIQISEVTNVNGDTTALTTYEVNENTKVHLIDGEDSGEIAVADLAVQTIEPDVSGTDSNNNPYYYDYHQVILSGDIIIVFADPVGVAR